MNPENQAVQPVPLDNAEMAKRVAKTLGEVISFSTDPEFRRSCLQLLDVTNSYDAQMVLREKLASFAPKAVPQPEEAAQPENMVTAIHVCFYKDQQLSKLAFSLGVEPRDTGRFK